VAAADDRAIDRASVELLERSTFLEALGTWLDEARDGRGRLVLLGGEAGVGKSVLVARFCAQQAASARVLRGACERLYTPRALGPLADMADELGGELEQLIAGDAKPRDVVPALLRDLRSHRPTVVVLEDVHWADEATLDLLRLLGTRIGPAPAVVVATFRDDELDVAHPLRIVLGELATAPDVERLRLERLSLGAVRQLAEPYGADEDELFRITAGNPFFVTEILGAGAPAIPETVRDAVLARAAPLSDEARSLLEGVAVVPSRVEPWLLEAIAGGDLSHLDACLASGMLCHEGGVIRFRHELARQTIEEATPPPVRIAHHRVVLQALAAPPAGAPDPARLAHHAEAAGDTEAVLAYAPLAGAQAVAHGAHREAAAQYGRALRFAGDLPPEERVTLLERRAHECWLVDQLEESLEAARGALACRRVLGDPLGEGNSLRELSRALLFVDRADEAERAALEAVERLEQLPPGSELAQAYNNVALLRLLANDNTDAVRWGERALEVGERIGDAATVADALGSIGSAEFSGGMSGWQEHLERGYELARESGLDEQTARILDKLAVMAVHSRDFGAADRYLADGLEHTEERDLARWRANLLMVRAQLELARGRWDEADDAASQALAARTWPHVRLTALSVLGRVRARRGDPGVWALLDEAQKIAVGTNDLDQVGPAATARAEARWLEGGSDAVAAETDEALLLARVRADAWWLGELAWLRRLGGIDEEAPPGAAEPYALQLAGDWSGATAGWEQLGCPYEAALALAEGDEAAQRSALEALRSLGAVAASRRVESRLRAAGARGVRGGARAATLRNPASLTSRQLEVLTLLADGLQNREIAARLVVSTRTVDHHVSAIFRKLGVGSRAEARAEAIRLGVVPKIGSREPEDR
jgi:ATP/maltotriose-dependent transcriptional regulator MalT